VPRFTWMYQTSQSDHPRRQAPSLNTASDQSPQAEFARLASTAHVCICRSVTC
jgi:hypothetical protein